MVSTTTFGTNRETLLSMSMDHQSEVEPETIKITANV
jgi:hypothetical protein